MKHPTAALRSRKRLRRTLWQSHMTAQRASGLTNARNKHATLLLPTEFDGSNIAQVG
jgi:hypothetical protein